MTLFKNSKMTYQVINGLERFENLNQDIVNNIMDFINPSIKTYKKMFRDTIEYISYFVDFDVGYVEIKENKKDKLLSQAFVEFKFEKYEEDNGLFYYYLTSVETLYFNKKRENISMGFIKIILNFELDEQGMNICWCNTDSEDEEEDEDEEEEDEDEDEYMLV